MGVGGVGQGRVGRVVVCTFGCARGDRNGDGKV